MSTWTHLVVFGLGTGAALALGMLAYRRLAHHAWLAGSSVAAGIVLLWLVLVASWKVAGATMLIPLWTTFAALFSQHVLAAKRLASDEVDSGVGLDSDLTGSAPGREGGGRAFEI